MIAKIGNSVHKILGSEVVLSVRLGNRLEEKTRAQAAAHIKISSGNNVQPRRELQKNIETINLDIDAKIAAESQHRIIVPIAATIVAHPDVRPGAIIKIESWAGAEGFEKQPVYVHKEKIAVVVVKIPCKKNVEAHGFGAAKMEV